MKKKDLYNRLDKDGKPAVFCLPVDPGFPTDHDVSCLAITVQDALLQHAEHLTVTVTPLYPVVLATCKPHSV